MFLSRVEIPWAAARNAYEIHRQVWKLFPGEERESRAKAEEVRQGFLFRVEDARPGMPARLLVQSRRAPQASADIALLGSREFCPQPKSGQRLAFILTANPVKSIRDALKDEKPGKRADSCRVPLIREEEQREWLARKLPGAVEVEGITVLPHKPLYFRKGQRAGKLITVTFEGVLQVTDTDKLVASLENGVGPAKAFGCGLLLVRRI